MDREILAYSLLVFLIVAVCAAAARWWYTSQSQMHRRSLTEAGIDRQARAQCLNVRALTTYWIEKFIVASPRKTAPTPPDPSAYLARGRKLCAAGNGRIAAPPRKLTMERPIPSDIVEQWMTHLRLQRTRARDMVWLMENGATLHDGRKGEAMTDATERWLSEQRTVIADVDRLLALYESINA